MLRHKISNKGTKVDRTKIEMIRNIPQPILVKGVRSFLNHVGYYRRFIKDFIKIANPLCKLLEKKASSYLMVSSIRH